MRSDLSSVRFPEEKTVSFDEQGLGLKAVFRTVAGPGIGIGHVMRCLTLAETLVDRGFTCALAAEVGGLSSVPPSRLRGTDVLSADAEPAGTDLLVIDDYGLDARYERAARRWATMILVIDDLANRDHDCDLLLDPTPARTTQDYEGRTPAECEFLLNPDFAPLQPSFPAARCGLLPRPRRPARRLLITFGGSDAKGLTFTALEGVQRAALDLDVDIVLPESAPHFRELTEKTTGAKVTLRGATDDLAPLMTAADLCLGAGGTTAWERACLGLPTLLLSTAKNQAGNIAALTEAGAAVAVEPVTADAIAGALGDLAGDAEKLHAMSTAAAALCDGLGAGRVADAVLRRLPSLSERRRAQ